MLRAIDRHCQPFLAHTVLPSAFLFIFHHTTPSIKQKERVDKRPNIINMQHSIPYDVIQYVIIRMNVSKFVAKTRVFHKTIFSQFYKWRHSLFDFLYVCVSIKWILLDLILQIQICWDRQQILKCVFALIELFFTRASNLHKSFCLILSYN